MQWQEYLDFITALSVMLQEIQLGNAFHISSLYVNEVYQTAKYHICQLDWIAHLPQHAHLWCLKKIICKICQYGALFIFRETYQNHSMPLKISTALIPYIRIWYTSWFLKKGMHAQSLSRVLLFVTQWTVFLKKKNR